MIKNIMLLTKISTMNYIENINIIDKKTNKINKKSIYFWMIIILFLAIFFLSSKIIETLSEYGQVNIFPNIYFTFMFILLIFQAILICPNIFYFSKDIENILAFPFKPIEIFLSKFNTLVTILLGTESVFMLIPMIRYGIMINIGIGFYIALLFVLIAFPIYISLIISIINIIFINFFKFIKNENIYQLIMSTIIITIVFLGEFIFIKNTLFYNTQLEESLINLNTIAININKTTLIINPLIEILHNKNLIINILRISLIYIIILLPLLGIGSKTYLKKILSINSHKVKKVKKINLEDKCKSNSVEISYLKNEFKNIFNNSAFFMQYIFPILILLILAIIITVFFEIKVIDSNPEFVDQISQIKLSIEGFIIILVGLQVLFSFINLSITSVSRYGTNANFIKYIPIDFYKQFYLKSSVQIIISATISMVTVIIIKYLVPQISIIHILLLFVDALLLGILNSIIMVIVDLKNPVLNWKSEYEIIKQNNNKLFQYVYTIIIVLILMYLMNILDVLNINISILVITLILILFIIIINLYIKNQIKKNKLFEKIQ